MKIVERRSHTYTFALIAAADVVNSVGRLQEFRVRVDELCERFRQNVADRCGVPLKAVNASVTVSRGQPDGTVTYHVQAFANAMREEEWPEVVLAPAAPSAGA